MSMSAPAWGLALLAAMALAACDKATNSGNANAPGSPGTGNPPVVATPMAPDTQPGGTSGVAGSLPHPGSSGGDAVMGATGSVEAARRRDGHGWAPVGVA